MHLCAEAAIAARRLDSECQTPGKFLVVSAPDIDKLEIYARLAVSEVWIIQSGNLAIHRLDATLGAYAVVERSGVVPELDVAELLSFVRLGESQTALARAYRDALRSRAASPPVPEVV